MSMKTIIESEMHCLREELRDLKGYQFKLLSLAATGTGFILSLSRLRLESDMPVPPSPLLYLLPLVVILPSWCIFFDKAKTITRIVGYYRVAEQNLRKNPEPTAEEFPGWETSLRLFREHERNDANVTATLKPGKRLQHLVDSLLLITSQRYWMLAYYTFSALTLVCLAIPLRSAAPSKVIHPHAWSTEGVFLGVALCLTMGTAIFNGVVLSRLVWGQHSYDRLENMWKAVLSSKISESLSDKTPEKADSTAA